MSADAGQGVYPSAYSQPQSSVTFANQKSVLQASLTEPLPTRQGLLPGYSAAGGPTIQQPIQISSAETTSPIFRSSIGDSGTQASRPRLSDAARSRASYTIPLKGEGGRVVSSQPLCSGLSPSPVVSTGLAPALSSQTPSDMYGTAASIRNANQGITSATGMQAPTSVMPQQSGFRSSSNLMNPRTAQGFEAVLVPKSKILQSDFLHDPSTGKKPIKPQQVHHLDRMRGTHDERQNTSYLIAQMESPEMGKMHLAEQMVPTFNQSPNGDYLELKDDFLFVPSNRNVDSLADLDEEQEDEDEINDPTNLQSIKKSARELKDQYALAMHNNIDESQAELIEEYKRRSTLADAEMGLNIKKNEFNSPPATGKVSWSSSKPQDVDNRRIPGFQAEAVDYFLTSVPLRSDPQQPESRDRCSHRRLPRPRARKLPAEGHREAQTQVRRRADPRAQLQARPSGQSRDRTRARHKL